MVIARGWREGAVWSCCLMDGEFQFEKRKKVLEMHGDGLHNNVMSLMPPNCTFKWCLNGKILCYVYVTIIFKN